MKINKLHAFASVISVLAIMYMYIDFLGQDNVRVMYNDIFFNDYPGWVGHLDNYRYAAAAFAYVLFKTGIPYYDMIYLWVVLFGLSLAWASYEFARFCRFPVSTVPFFIFIVAANGYMADMYLFSMVFNIYALAYSAVALCLRVCRKMPNAIGYLIAIILAFIALTSYQPTALILLFASALYAIHMGVTSDEGMSLREAFIPVIAFIVSVLVFISIKEAFPLQTGRDASFHNIIGNLPHYIRFIPTMLLKGMSPYTTRYEVLVYTFAIVCMSGMLIWHLAKHRNMHTILGAVALTCGILIIASPFSLFPSGFWPSARQMSGSVFFLAGSLVLVSAYLPKRVISLTPYLAVAFIAVLITHQAKFFAVMKGQDERDALAVAMIINEIRASGDISPSTKLAVSSTIHNDIRSGNRLSAFDTTWSNMEIFRILTGDFIKGADYAPEGTCLTPPESYWRIEKTNNMIVVCMK